MLRSKTGLCGPLNRRRRASGGSQATDPSVSGFCRQFAILETAEMPSSTAQTARTRAAASSAGEKIDAMVRRIVERFDPKKVILFGSHARGTSCADSDVDLLVVMTVRGSKRDTQVEIRRALREFRVPKDVIVTTPEDFAWRKEIPGTIERPAAREGKVLYARP